MKRSAFLASFLGVLGISQAQQWKERLPHGVHCWHYGTDGTVVPCDDSWPPALNNQCPVCGTMAKPYRRMGMSLTGTVRIDPPGDMPKHNLARCLRCNAAFWQNSEDNK